MKIEIIEKALYYYYSGLINIEEETKDKIFFEVDGEKVHFVKGMGYIYLKCTCKFCSLKTQYHTFCARQIACILYLSHQYIKKKQRKRGG